MLDKRAKNTLLSIAIIIMVAVMGLIAYKSFFGTKSAPKAVAVVAPVAQKSIVPVVPVIQKSVGMVLTGCGQDDAWLKNTNPCDVLVRHIQRSLSTENFGERTNWMKEIKMGDSLRVNVGPTSTPLNTSYSLYIYNTAGGLVGFLSGDCPPLPLKK